MPFVQRVVQPTRLANTAANVSGKTITFQCLPGKCKNNNCINKQKPLQQQEPQQEQSQERERLQQREPEREHEREREREREQRQLPLDNAGLAERIANESTREHNNGDVSRTRACVKDITVTTTTTTTAIIHVSSNVNGDAPTGDSSNTADVTDHAHSFVNGFASSFTYATDTEEDVVSALSPLKTAPPPTLVPMKKLKQHVEFLSTAPSPSRSTARSSIAQKRQPTSGATTPQSPTAAKIISGYEFESISNITLSNALRQLASLVLIASDIFDELQRELQSIGERSRTVQRKIVAVEQRVCAYDPKMVTVPESDLLTCAQRKIHYESDKAVRKELFTVATRPRSVRVLYDDAGKKTPPPQSAASTPHSTGGFSDGNGELGMADISDTGAGSDELVCSPVFGNANRKMRTQIDAEIEIRLPAAIEDLRKWTSTEALGDVTVTPDCMHHVDTSISTSVVIGDNGVLTPALSPSVLSADAVDALYSINVSNTVNTTQIPNDICKDVPLNHRLPSPEEQCKIIALRYPAEVISVDTSGKRFERMCMVRKSTTGCYTNMADANNLNEQVQTVSRRSRSRKVRGKRRNTIAGIDQKEIQDAANGDTTATSGEFKNTPEAASNGIDGDTDAVANNEDARRCEKAKKFGRSKSSDILKKESVALPYDKGKSTLTRLNSLKQWGRNRFKFMQRTEAIASDSSTGGANQDTGGAVTEKAKERATSSGGSSSKSPNANNAGNRSRGDIDEDCIVHELISQKSESRFSHERKPSYSSSEKSMSVSSSGHLRGRLHLATCGNVKLRDTSTLNRQRRNGILANGLGGKDEQPHSSSGNWSASSESGRASIGSEITIQPKSSASNTSLNVSSFHPGSGPPSSMLSRRRFLNTSASSSVTSEGTATPDLQVAEGGYPNHLDDETSSAYSCDTEGYYTSFHMDSGLRTLKEEESPLSNHLNVHTSNYSFGSQSNQTVLSAENEYELFGRGSTSTTTSSAGTVCTTLLVVGGPDVPERISSLGKLSKSDHSNNASTSTLERSYSSSTIGSTLERTGTIKRNVNAGLKLAVGGDEESNQMGKPSDTPESQDDEFDFQQQIHKRPAQPIPIVSAIAAEVDCSESSDLEGVERIERIKQKTTINAKRIPSMCIITPSTSDDENQSKDGTCNPNRELSIESSLAAKAAAKTAEDKPHESASGGTSKYPSEHGGCATVDERTPTSQKPVVGRAEESRKDHNLNVVKRNSSYGFNNMFEKLKVVLPNIKSVRGKSSQVNCAVNDDELYDTAGEYVTIADISNNNRLNQLQAPKAVGASGLGIYYSNDIVRRKLAAEGDDSTVVADRRAVPTQEVEYVSLNELPYNLRKIGSSSSTSTSSGPGNNAVKATVSTSSDTPDFYSAIDENPQRECAESVQHGESTSSQPLDTAIVPMYAEISEIQESLLSSPLLQNKGARVRVNAQGKIIYDSDSLKRRKGGHTTFAPGPHVKETESALAQSSRIYSVIGNANDNDNDDAPTEHSAATAENQRKTIYSESASTAKVTKENLLPKNSTAKLLLLNGGVAAARKVANVRPIVAKSPLSQSQRYPTDNADNTLQRANESDMSITTSSPYRSQASPTYYQENNKNILANRTNPLFKETGTVATEPSMMPSPSTKSTSSTGSTVSSTTSGSSLASTSSKEEGYQRFFKAGDGQLRQQQQPKVDATDPKETPFQRNGPIYWTLQNRRQQKPQLSSTTCRDDLYATPIRRSERAAAAAAAASSAAAQNAARANISPIVPLNRNGFQTSTPTKGLDSQVARSGLVDNKALPRSAAWNDDSSPERLNTCSDRIGQSKTSLMDFKKLLLAKSAKTSPIQRKVSAVELLKKANAASNAAAAAGGATASTSGQVDKLDSSMKLLDLSGSPKTFANRRMLRQGQFGSPSKSFVPKMKSTKSVNAWRNNTPVPHTDVMSTTIPEDHSEEDRSKSSCEREEAPSGHDAVDCGAVVGDVHYDLKENFFIQAEANNFMRGGDVKRSFSGKIGTSAPSAPAPTTNAQNNRPIVGKAAPTFRQCDMGDQAAEAAVVAAVAAVAAASQMPALETAL